jgi:hypothetical protein
MTNEEWDIQKCYTFGIHELWVLCKGVGRELDVWKFEPFDLDLEGSFEKFFEDECRCHLSSLVIYDVIRENSMKYLIPNTILPLTYYG